MSADVPRMPEPPAIAVPAHPPDRAEVNPPPMPPKLPVPPVPLACMVEVRPGARVFDIGPVRDSIMESTGRCSGAELAVEDDSPDTVVTPWEPM